MCTDYNIALFWNMMALITSAYSLEHQKARQQNSCDELVSSKAYRNWAKIVPKVGVGKGTIQTCMFIASNIPLKRGL